MSHYKQRKETNCLNCNTEVLGKYCQNCGQENIEPHETAWHLVTHFFNDITHFDGMFFQTVKYLITKPGFVTKEYVLGRRASYLNPIRMYVFTSAIFFLIFFSVNKFNIQNIETKYNGKKLSAINKMDSTEFAEFTKEVNDDVPMSRQQFKNYTDTVQSSGFKITPNEYNSKAQYDSALKAGKDHNWIERRLTYKQIELNEKYQHDRNKILSGFISSVVHSFPQMLFVSLPIFALILKLLYIRRKNFYYSNHVIFSTHLYVFVFIVLLLILGLNQLKDQLHWDWLTYVLIAVYAYIFFYEYKAMRNFYCQRRGKTIMKYLLLNFIMFFIILLLFVAFSFFSLLNM
ncbi:MAG: DUF3667 domain-containing protein [Ferruginibacter sp.]